MALRLNGCRGRDILLICIASLFLPLIVLASKAGWTVQAAGEIDSFVYTGLIHNPTEVLSRYGVTYYANRVMATEPLRFLVWLAGDKWGHLGQQYLCLFAMTLGAAYLALRYYGPLAALLSAAWICFNPCYVRSISWDYVDGFAVTYLTISLYLLVLPVSRERWFHALAGVFLAFACNVNLHSLFFALGLAPFYFLVLRPAPREACIRFLAGVAGFVVGYCAVSVLQYAQYPPFGFFREIASVWIGISLLGGAMHAWSSPLWPYVASGQAHVFVPVILAVLLAAYLILVTGGSVRRYLLAAFSTVVATIAIFLVLHALGDAVVTMYYYFTYAIPSMILGMIALFGEACEEAKKSPLLATIASAGVPAIVLCWVFYSAVGFGQIELYGYLALIAACLLLTLFGKAPRVVAIAVLLPFLSAGLFYYSKPTGLFAHSGPYFANLHDKPRARASEDLYRAAVAFQQIVSDELRPGSGSVGFWYSNRPFNPLDALQSTYLWGYSRIAGAEAGNPGMPALSDKELDRIRTLDRVVLIGANEAEIARGVAALRDANLPVEMIAQKRLGTKEEYAVAVVQISKKPVQ